MEFSGLNSTYQFGEVLVLLELLEQPEMLRILLQLECLYEEGLCQHLANLDLAGVLAVFGRGRRYQYVNQVDEQRVAALDKLHIRHD